MTNLTPNEKEVILTMAKCDMNVTQAGKELYRPRSGVIYWIERMKKNTGLDARKFYDLVKLVGMVEKE